jgi:DNA-binding CsgD family transcriptional regulator
MIPISMPVRLTRVAGGLHPPPAGLSLAAAPARIVAMVTGQRVVTRAMTTAPDALSLFAEASAALRRRVPFDAAIWHATDPATGLATAPMRAENLGEESCAAFWDCELLSEQVNRFRDLARATVPAAGLREATADAPQRSATYRRFLRPRAMDDELRAVLRVDGQWWGQVSLYRRWGTRRFDRRDVATVVGLSPVLGARLRTFASPVGLPAAWPAGEPGEGAVDDDPGGPGLLLFDPTGELASANDAARAFLDGMPPGPSAPTRFGIRVPAWVHSTAALARTRTSDGARIRARDRSGRWLVFHASCLRDAEGTPGQTAVVVEPAKAPEIAAMLAAAYELTERELELTQLVARGLSTEQLAARLFISRHTVRDHLKAIFAKTGVSSRGELVAALYTEHYSPSDGTGRVRVWDR